MRPSRNQKCAPQEVESTEGKIEKFVSVRIEMRHIGRCDVIRLSAIC